MCPLAAKSKCNVGGGGDSTIPWAERNGKREQERAIESLRKRICRPLHRWTPVTVSWGPHTDWIDCRHSAPAIRLKQRFWAGVASRPVKLFVF